jgi:hypothetical protein
MTKKFLLVAFASIFITAINGFSQGFVFDSLKANVATGFGHKIYGVDAGTRSDLHFAVRANTPVWTDAMIISSTGYVSLGAGNPNEKLTIVGNISVQPGNAIGAGIADHFTYDGKFQPHYAMQWVTDSWSSAGPTWWVSGYGGMKFFTQGALRMSIDGTGNVGIGTTVTGTNKLAVEGTIAARRMRVTQTSPWPDFVFDPSYQLLSLKEIENYVAVNKHLPAIPSAKEVEKNGQDLGEMNRALLQKVEEQTLYLISLQKQVDQLKQLVKEIQEKK